MTWRGLRMPSTRLAVGSLFSVHFDVKLQFKAWLVFSFARSERSHEAESMRKERFELIWSLTCKILHAVTRWQHIGQALCMHDCAAETTSETQVSYMFDSSTQSSSHQKFASRVRPNFHSCPRLNGKPLSMPKGHKSYSNVFVLWIRLGACDAADI
jgi:hypothetical protein